MDKQFRRSTINVSWFGTCCLFEGGFYNCDKFFINYCLRFLFYRNIAIEMGATKTAHFSESQNQMAELAKALGHPARIAILQFLAKQEQCVCGSIVGKLGLAQATVSQHLKALKDAGLIKGTIDGTSTCYCLNPEGVQTLRQMLNDLLNECCSPSCC
jgi:ArsR family transcriptional regulator